MGCSTYLYSICVLFVISTCQGKDIAPGVSEYLYCEGCIATVKELTKLTDKKTSDSRDLVVSEAIEKVCSLYNFVSYHYSPPRTLQACKLLLERHDEAIEVAFVKQHKGDLEDIVCNQISNACTNVDRSEKPRDSSGLDLSGGAEKVQKEIKIDPQTGQPVLEKNTKKSKENEPKTLSKKDKKAKKDKKKTKDKKKVATKTEKKKAKKEGGANIINVDINDPDSMESVLAQIQQATQEHQQEFYKNQEEENKKKAKEEL